MAAFDYSKAVNKIVELAQTNGTFTYLYNYDFTDCTVGSTTFRLTSADTPMSMADKYGNTAYYFTQNYLPEELQKLYSVYKRNYESVAKAIINYSIINLFLAACLDKLAKHLDTQDKTIAGFKVVIPSGSKAFAEYSQKSHLLYLETTDGDERYETHITIRSYANEAALEGDLDCDNILTEYAKPIMVMASGTGYGAVDFKILSTAAITIELSAVSNKLTKFLVELLEDFKDRNHIN